LNKKSVIEITGENDKFLYNFLLYIDFFGYWKKIDHTATAIMSNGEVVPANNSNQDVSFFNYLK